MKIAIVQTNPILGAFKQNSQKILQNILNAKKENCDLVIFPECSLFGYHPFDMLERKKLIDQQMKELDLLHKKIPEGIGALVGVIRHNKSLKGRPYFNSVSLLQKNKAIRFFNKELLPTGDVFDEARFIENGRIEDNVFLFKRKKFLLTICEDIWAWPDEKGLSPYKKNPFDRMKNQKFDFVINMSASPFYPGKSKIRERLVSLTAQHFQAPMVYVNLVGGQDEVIYDGSSFGVDHFGKKLFNLKSFEEDSYSFELGSNRVMEQDFGNKKLSFSKLSNKNIENKNIEEIHKALLLGIRDFCKKTKIEKVHLGISGGIDSAVVACLAVEALGANKVSGIAIPGPFSSPMSLKLSKELCKNLGISLYVVSIQKTYESLKALLKEVFKINKFGLVHENLQARLRGLLLMAYSNHEKSLLLATGNKSELATGYSTLYGDLCGGLLPIGDLTKDQVYQIADLYNCEEKRLIPEKIITRAPSAELRPNQKDQDSLPPYEALDLAVISLVENAFPVKQRAEKWLLPILMRTEFKRWQSPPILKVSKHSFGRGRRFPIAQQSKEK